MGKQAALLVSALFFGLPAAAADTLALRPAQALGSTEIGAGYVRESVSNQPNAWTESHVELLHKFGDRKLVIARITGTERFGLHDNTVSVSGYYPLAKDTTLYAEAAASDTHRVLPRDRVHLQLAQTLGAGWVVSAGLKRVRYDTTTVDTADLTLERYFADIRAAFTALPGRSSTAGSAASYRAQLGYYYANENNVQLVVASGEEVDQPIAAGIIVKTDVRSTAVYGRHWFARDWAFTYAIGRTRQGPSTREAAGVGLRYRF